MQHNDVPSKNPKPECYPAAAQLAEKREAMIQGFLEGKTADFQIRHTRIMDDYFRQCTRGSRAAREMAAKKLPFTVVALGGYGRMEQCIHSDVDLLFLFENEIPDPAEALIRETIYPLWDMGFQVSHTLRTLAEPIRIDADDVEVFTALLDARYVAGAGGLLRSLKKKFRKEIISPSSDDLVQWLIRENRKRHDRFGDATFLLEPNLKEGQGGLRDYHTILWVARVRSNVKTTRDLEYYGYLLHDEFDALSASLRFIWQIRNHLHHLAGRKYDQLLFEHQERAAERMGYTGKREGQQPVERFLGDLHEQMELIKLYHRTFVHEVENLQRRHHPRPGTAVWGLTVRRGMYGFASPEAILTQPMLLIKIFEASARQGLPLSSEAKRLLRHFLYLVDEDFRNSPLAIRFFERILLLPATEFNILNEMLITGFLERFIPEFGNIINRIQFDRYHLHPVDKHLIRTVHTIKRFGGPDDPAKGLNCGEIYGQIQGKKLLMWAALLHDIGKGKVGGRHAEKGVPIILRILRERGYSDAEIETVALLTREHLLLVETATRRDIHDEETALFCARRIREINHLKMLFLLTIADSIATGPKAWNPWNLSLTYSLYLNVLNVLKHGELTSEKSIFIMERKKQQVLQLEPYAGMRGQIEEVFKELSPRYLLYTEPRKIRAHMDLYQELKDLPFVWKIDRTRNTMQDTMGEGDIRTVTICARDVTGLFSKIAGVLTLNGVDILNAQIYTWQNGIALDIFQVKPPPDPIFEAEKWETARQHLMDALGGRLDLSEQLKARIHRYGHTPGHGMDRRPTTVAVDNETSSFFTIIEVITNDFPGLLFAVTHALFRFDLDIRVAKIATKVDQVVDVFYVRDINGEKVTDPDAVERIKQHITSVLP